MRIYHLLFLLIYLHISYKLSSQNWAQVSEPSNTVTRILIDTPKNVMYIGGGFKYFDSIVVNGIVQWDGVNAFPLGMGRSKDCWEQNCFDLVLLVKFNNEIYIGRISDSISGVAAKGIARWNGQSWTDVGGGVSNLKTGESAIPFDGYAYEGKLLIGGAFDQAGTDTIYSLSAWDNTKWQSLYVPPSQSGESHFITSLSYYKDRLYAAGNFIMYLDGEVTHDIAYLEDSIWHPVAGGLKGGLSYVNDMVVFENELYICGYFQSAAGNVGNKIMRWDGHCWKSVGDGLCSQFDIAERMLIHNNQLFVVGTFECVNNEIPASCIASWDGDKWCSFGNSKFNNKIRDIAFWNDDLYIGGGFTEIDGHPVKYFAKWVGDHTTDTCSAPVVSVPAQPGGRPSLALRPNPVSDMLRVALPKAAVTVRVYDLAGREMSGKTTLRASEALEAVLEVEALPAGWYLLQVVFRDGSSAAAGFVKT